MQLSKYNITKKAYDCQYTYLGDKEERPAERGDLDILYEINTLLVHQGVLEIYFSCWWWRGNDPEIFFFTKSFVPNDHFPAQHVIDRAAMFACY